MTKIYFGKNEEVFNIETYSIKSKLLLDELPNFKEDVINKFSDLSLDSYIRNSLKFLEGKNISLPEKVKIIYTHKNPLDKFITSSKSLYERAKIKIGLNGFDRYSMPASVNLNKDEIYISYNYLNNQNNQTKLYREQFDNNIQMMVDHALYHELGHLFLVEMNKDKVISKTNNDLENKLKIQIEEGFAESFAMQMLSLKYQDFKPNDMIKLRNHQDSNSNKAINSFDYLENNGKEPPAQKAFSTHEFKNVYDNLPITKNGEIVSNLNSIYSELLKVSLQNNENRIKEKTDIFKIEKIKQELDRINEKVGTSTLQTIDKFQNKAVLEGFNVEKIPDDKTSVMNRIKAIKDKFLIAEKSSNKNKL